MHEVGVRARCRGGRWRGRRRGVVHNAALGCDLLHRDGLLLIDFLLHLCGFYASKEAVEDEEADHAVDEQADKNELHDVERQVRASEEHRGGGS